ncbi:nucleophile aminohydrolase [Bisporella sp. PMI_857]|nr:nucleophile aminohydrolase [Bisporella sp. PMI_857]
MRRPHNGDGFGIGYYTDQNLGPEPCIFTSTTPAWNCINLQRIASKTASRLIFAHVRATTQGSLSDDNCHPFYYRSLMWMHNGGLGGWTHIRRRLQGQLADKWFNAAHGSTDSEWAFALYLDTLERMGHDPSSPPPEGFGPTVLRQAMLKTIKNINDLIKAIPENILGEGEDTRSLLNFALSDGHSVVCTRYVSSLTEEAASLFYSSGTSWEDRSQKGQYQMDRKDKGADIVLVASEPLTFERQSWVTVPTNSVLTIHKQTVMVHPIIDEYYNHNPYYSRSSNLVHDRGLVSDEKGTAAPTTKPVISSINQRFLGSSPLNDGLTSNLTPSMHMLPPLTVSPDPTPLPTPGSSDIRHLSSLKNVNTSQKPQELGNTKKKRKSLSGNGRENLIHQQYQEPDEPEPRAVAYGDPLKIAQYFPELN